MNLARILILATVGLTSGTIAYGTFHHKPTPATTNIETFDSVATTRPDIQTDVVTVPVAHQTAPVRTVWQVPAQNTTSDPPIFQHDDHDREDGEEDAI